MDNKQQEYIIKQNYINENIISKGYNIEDLSNFVSRTRGVKVEDLPMKILMKVIEQFKNEKLSQTFASFADIKSDNKKQNEKEKEKEEPLFDIFYAPNAYELSCKSQDENPLNMLEKQNIKLTLEVTEAKKNPVKSIFGTSSYFFSYKVNCKDLNTTVYRTYQDFEWLSQKLSEQYPLRCIPPLKKFKIYEVEKDDTIPIRIRYINKFLEAICRKKILRSSLLLYSFISLPDEKYNKLKAKKDVFTLSKSMENYVTYSGKLTFDLTKEKAIYMNALSRLLSPTITNFDKLNTAIEHLANDFNNISIHTKELSEIIAVLEFEAKKLKFQDNIRKAYAYLSDSFYKLSSVFAQQKEIFNTDIKEYFDFMKMEYNQITSLTKEFDVCKNNYEDYITKLHEKKEALYQSKNITKWEMDPEDLTDYETLKEDKRLAYEKMCYKENIEAESMKKKLTLVINVLLSQYEKVKKYQDERITDFIDKFSEKYAKFTEPNLNFIKLISEVFI